MGVNLSEGRLLVEQFLGMEGVSYHMADIQQSLGIRCSLRFPACQINQLQRYIQVLLADCDVPYALHDSYTSRVRLTEYKAAGFRR